MRYSPARLRAARDARKLSREAVARRAGCTAGTVYRYETGAITPDARTLAELAGIYQVTVCDLYDPEPADARCAR